MTRNRPWRAQHPDAVIVDRRTKWGNPFVVGEPYRWDFLCWPYPIRPGWVPSVVLGGAARVVADRAQAVELFRAWLENGNQNARDFAWSARRDLAGRDLACWCPLDGPCHADVLLAIANGGVL
jgi:hypothetical protein